MAGNIEGEVGPIPPYPTFIPTGSKMLFCLNKESDTKLKKIKCPCIFDRKSIAPYSGDFIQQRQPSLACRQNQYIYIFIFFLKIASY